MALTQIVTTDSVSASVVNTKIVDPANTALAGLQIAQTAGGTATAITLTGVELINGYQKTFVINASNSGSATTVNGKPLYKPGGKVAPNLVAGKAATVWYNLAGDCFFYKASAEGTAVAGDVLAGKTFSNDDDAGITGTLVLTGDAIAADVRSGKTFYNTDAKTKLTGTSTAKKIATGFQDFYPATTKLVTVTGLTFTPAVIIIKYNSGTTHSKKVYTNQVGDGLTIEYDTSSGTATAITPNNLWTINSGGFSTIFDSPSAGQINWTAYE